MSGRRFDVRRATPEDAAVVGAHRAAMFRDVGRALYERLGFRSTSEKAYHGAPAVLARATA